MKIYHRGLCSVQLVTGEPGLVVLVYHHHRSGATASPPSQVCVQCHASSHPAAWSACNTDLSVQPTTCWTLLGIRLHNVQFSDYQESRDENIFSEMKEALDEALKNSETIVSKSFAPIVVRQNEY